MKRFGITGGIGTGKSTAMESLLRLGIKVVDSDLIARALTEPGQPAMAEIRSLFGERFVREDGQLDRSGLGRLVFSDFAALAALEAILHPRIHSVWNSQLDSWEAEGSRLGFVVIPLLFEKTYEAEFDGVVATGCSDVTQRTRLQLRGWDDGIISTRLASQLNIEEKLRRADHVVWTEGSFRAHEDQWRYLLPQLEAVC